MSHTKAAVTSLMGAAILFALVLPASATDRTQAKLDDATIVAIFDAANTADIETGNLAAKQGSSAEVREFGPFL